MSDPRFSFLKSVTDASDDQDDSREQIVRGTTIQIRVSPDTIATFAGQVLTYQLATLVARLFDRVQIDGDESVGTHPNLRLLAGPFISALRGLLPTLRPVEPMDERSRITVVIGKADNITGDIFLGATAWSAVVATLSGESVLDTMNPVGALAAGTLGAGEVFKLAFKGSVRGAVEAQRYTLSMLNYRQGSDDEPLLPESIILNATLCGCGSIVCGLLLGILVTPQLRGNLTLVDNGRFDNRNPYKYALLNWTDAEEHPYKAVWAQKQLHTYAGDQIASRAYVGTAQAYVSTLQIDYKLPLVISAVDTVEARLEIQDTLPRRILNAGIDGTLVEVSVHAFGEGPCLACLGMKAELESWNAKPIADATGLPVSRVHQLIRDNEGLTEADIMALKSANKLQAEFIGDLDSYAGQPLLSLWNRAAYSEAVVTTSKNQQTRVTTAFVSAFAGVLLLSELIKEQVTELHRYRVANSYRQDLLGIPAEDVFKHERESNGWCLCHSSYRQALYGEKYKV